jgi:ring-1,2-phenylacetyl-CoA epoxidase subunit PaaD
MVTAGSTTEAGAAAAAARHIVAQVPDPEIPVLTIADLGVLRDVVVDQTGRVEVTITPTYSGCPAIDAIRDDVRRVLADRGYADVAVRTVLAPAWTTDWISEAGRRALAEHGVAPPGPAPARAAAAGPVFVPLAELALRCPRCGSADTREISRFGSTACKALRACNACAEPFDQFKAH